MRIGIEAACALVGFPTTHAQVISNVAQQLNTVIAFREVGVACTGLLREGYATKGFRIDTKSCDWGPMSGFVCADPRLNKKPGDAAVRTFNQQETTTALAGAPGHATGGAPGAAELRATWSAGYGPLVISGTRITDLQQARDDKMRIRPRYQGKEMVGESTRGGLTVQWRLIHIDPGDRPLFVRRRTQASENHYYAVCAEPPFQQQYPAGTAPIPFRGHDVLLGLCNPGMFDEHGFKACVTGDYDLFCVWPHESLGDRDWDQRAITPGATGQAAQQHYLLGNISRRINFIKVFLNSQLQAAGAFPTTGQLLHHSDEVGNPGGLAKPLQECFPILAFMGSDVLGLESIADLRSFTVRATRASYRIQLKPAWYGTLGIAPPQ
jgi:hypothetical protein